MYRLNSRSFHSSVLPGLLFRCLMMWLLQVVRMLLHNFLGYASHSTVRSSLSGLVLVCDGRMHRDKVARGAAVYVCIIRVAEK